MEIMEEQGVSSDAVFKAAQELSQDSVDIPADNLNKEGLVRGNRVWNTPSRDGKPGRRGLLDISRSSFLAKVKSGELPVEPVKLGKRTTAYRLSEILSI